MAERSNAAVLKTVEVQASGGSNPSLSAENNPIRMIKNQTPYVGKIKLAFDKSPYWSNGNSKLNAVHLNLGFTKLVSRIYPNKTKSGDYEILPETITRIEKETGLKVYTHKFGPNMEYELPNSVHTPDGKYVGSIEEGWWYVKNNLRSTKGSHPHTAWAKNTKQWIGYSHRGSCAFGKGDKLFDAKWSPKEEDLLKYEQYFTKKLDQYEKEYQEWEQSSSEHKAPADEMTMVKWATQFIPFKLRGSKTIHSYEDAYKAAVNFANYIS